MKDTFERLYKKNLEDFVLSFKREPNEKELEALRNITQTQVALIGSVRLHKDINKFLDFWQNSEVK